MLKKLIIKYLKNKHEFIRHQKLSLEVELEYSHGKLKEKDEQELVQRYEHWNIIELAFSETIKFLEADK